LAQVSENSLRWETKQDKKDIIPSLCSVHYPCSNACHPDSPTNWPDSPACLPAIS
jgi:hypothetical protein